MRELRIVLRRGESWGERRNEERRSEDGSFEQSRGELRIREREG